MGPEHASLRAKLTRLKRVVSYTYRHSFVSGTRENGVSVPQIAELLEHTSTGDGCGWADMKRCWRSESSRSWRT